MIDILAKQPPPAASPRASASAAFGGGEKKIGVPSAPQMVLGLLQGYEDSECVHSFEIGQREGGFYSARTDGQTHRNTQ